MFIIEFEKNGFFDFSKTTKKLSETFRKRLRVIKKCFLEVASDLIFCFPPFHLKRVKNQAYVHNRINSKMN